ncbi:hypothetical protein [Sneathiella limimaris]|uniref:hypothetical protein n=1 Tax=Sneathiella limimaris TaxID=1964213 RepID=UPI00146AB1B2|nr:hypothetical protein [Sneathiella limimaris]
MVWKLRQQNQKPSFLDGFQFEIAEDTGCLFVKHFDYVNGEILLQRAEYIRSVPQHRPNLNRIIDLRGVEVELTVKEAQAFVDKLHAEKNVVGPHRHAMILEDRLDHNILKYLASSFSGLVVQFKAFEASDEDLALNLRNWVRLPQHVYFPSFLNLKN